MLDYTIYIASVFSVYSSFVLSPRFAGIKSFYYILFLKSKLY